MTDESVNVECDEKDVDKKCVNNRLLEPCLVYRFR